MLRRGILVLLFLLGMAGSVSAQNFSGGFRFNMPANDTTAGAFLPSFPKQPITAADAITADGDQFVRNGAPIRFYGANLVADGAFPDKPKASYIAGRYRKLGFNLVRFHHIDNPWSERSLIPRNGASTRTLRTDMLDRMEYLIAHMKANGVYVNMNLHVSRTLTLADGIPYADSLAEYGKGVNFFDPDILALHREYASQLLLHVNPYTGLALKDDPVLAMVEITNENSLYFMWRAGMLRPFRAGGKLTAYHTRMLDARWNAYLAAKYGTTDALAAAWGSDAQAGANVLDGAFDASVPATWALEQHQGAAATVTRDETNPYRGAASGKVTVTNVTGTNWHIQWKHTGITIKKDSVYTVTFAARADAVRSVSVGVQRDVSPWDGFKSFSFTVTPQWQTYRFTFTAPETVSGQVRLSFSLGGAKGTTWIDAVEMRRSGLTGLLPGESIEARNVARIEHTDAGGYADARVEDITDFYMGLQNAYFDEMRRHLKETIGVKAPITGTNWNFGPADLAVQTRLDYVDNHSYWDHPQFPREPWSGTDWLINNQPMVRSSTGGALGGMLSGVAFEGKPYTISEYNHPFPNRFQSEGPLFLTAYAALHGVDGLMYFEYNGGTGWDNDKIEGYFSLHRNPVMMAQMPALALAYREGYIAPAKETLRATYSDREVKTAAKLDGNEWSGHAYFPRTLGLVHRIVTGSFTDTPPGATAHFPAAPAPPYTSDTGEITWDPQGVIRVGAPRFAGVTGFLSTAGASFGPARLRQGEGFGALTWVSLDGLDLATSRRSLLTLAGAAQNTGMVWTGTNTISDKWGRAPVEVQPLRMTLDLDVRADSLRISPLTPEGAPREGTVYYRRAGGGFTIEFDQTVWKSLWFGVEAFGDGTGSVDPGTLDLRLNAPFPNPVRAETTVGITLTAEGEYRLVVYDVLGREVREERRTDLRGTTFVRLDLSGLPSGAYFLILEQDGHRATQRLTLVR